VVTLAASLATITREDLVDLARQVAGHPARRGGGTTAGRLAPGFHVDRPAPLPGCGAPRLALLYAIADHKGWAGATAQIDVAVFREASSFDGTFATAHTEILFATSGPAAVDTDGSAATVKIPYSDRIIAQLPDDQRIPTYVRRLGVYLEYAFDVFCHGFGFADPTGFRTQPVTVRIDQTATAGPLQVVVPSRLTAELLSAYASHELFHVFQYSINHPTGRALDGSWYRALFEGGAVFAEDATADALNRYLLEAGTAFKGSGLLADPTQPLDTSDYKAAFFWRYVTEQLSMTREPDWPAYRRVFSAMTTAWSTSDLERALEREPGLDGVPCFRPARVQDAPDGEILSAQTVFGNFALACYLKDFMGATRDRRFEVVENDDKQEYYRAITGEIAEAPPMARVASSGPWRVHRSGLTFESTVAPFSHHVLPLDVAGEVPALEVRFGGDAALAGHSLFQALEICGDTVRDILRWDHADVMRRLAITRDGSSLTRLVLIVSGRDLTGTAPFRVAVTPEVAAPDVMVTRWNCRRRTEYELDRRTLGAPWTSPDVAVAGGGAPVPGVDNTIEVTVHNRGAVDAHGVVVTLQYQPGAPASLRRAAWAEATGVGGRRAEATLRRVPAGGSELARLAWMPPAGLAGADVCLRVAVVAPGDPNTDNKTALSLVRCRPAVE